MTPWVYLRDAASAELLVAFGEEYGLSEAQCLQGTGIAAREALTATDAEVAHWQELRIVRNLVSRIGDEPALGVRAGLRYHLALYGTLGLAAQTRPTLGDAIDLGLRLRTLGFNFHQPSMVRGGRSAALALAPARVPAEVTRFLLDRDLACWVTLAREMTPDVAVVRRIEFAGPSDGARAVYRRLFEEDVTFSGRRNAVVTETDTLASPMRQANAVLSRRYEQQCLELVAGRQARGGVSGQVRGLLRAAEGRPPDIAAVARELLTGERTLRRQLAAEGTSFRELVAEYRMARAERLLAATDATVEQIAAQLGYSEAAAFVRAFRRARGSTPTAYRASSRSTTTGAWSDGPSPLRASRST